MLAVMPYLESSDSPDLETSFRDLLCAAGGVAQEDAEVQPRLTFDVSLDGRSYAVSIVQLMSESDDLRPHLSPREMDIARLISKGLPTKTIAVRLGLRPCTVSTYTKRIYLKLNVNSRAEMVAKMLGEYSYQFYSMPS